MNRPVMRNVRVLRTKRELDRAYQVHAQGRERRRVATLHCGIIANILLGVSLGAWVLGPVAALPWWSTLLPSALLGALMVAGYRAVLASAVADRRERRRITELEQTLVTLTGWRSSASVVAALRLVTDGLRNASSGVVSIVSASAALPAVLTASAELAKAAGDFGAQDSFIEYLAREGTWRPAARSAPAESAVFAETAVDVPVEATGTVVVRPSRAVDSEEERLARLDADLDGETAVVMVAERETARRTSVYVFSHHAGQITRDMGMHKAVSRDGDEESSSRTKDFVTSPPTSASRGRSGRGKLFAEASAIGQEAQERATVAPFPQIAAESVQRTAIASTQPTPQTASRTAPESTHPVVRSQVPVVAAPVEAGGVVEEEVTTSTPPQGQRLIHVPVLTHTLTARIPRCSCVDPVVNPGTFVPVPARPQSARIYVPTPVEDGGEFFHLIDLDTILEGRRAAGR